MYKDATVCLDISSMTVEELAKRLTELRTALVQGGFDKNEAGAFVMEVMKASLNYQHVERVNMLRNSV